MVVVFALSDRFHYDDTPVIHKLQVEVRGTLALEDVDLQGAEHFH